MTKTTTPKVTKRQAEQVLAAVKRQFRAWLSADGSNSPVLIMDWDWLGYGPCPSIVWEGGPYDWTMYFPGGGIEEEFGTTVKPVTVPKGIWTEPMTMFAISIYREEV
jgi:hypothetical protein